MASRHIDPKAMQQVSRQVGQLEQYLNTGAIEANLRHLIKLRVSQINGCAHCMSMHTRDLLKHGERMDRISVVSAWRDCDWFTPRECAALAWSEAVTILPNREVPDEIWDQVRAEFNDQEIADLTLTVITINCWNRLSVPFHNPPDHFEAEEVLAAAAAAHD